MLRIYKFILFLFSIACLDNGYSQENIIHYSTKNGLPHDITYGLFQDSDGYLWIGTDNGLAKFNGQHFKLFNKNLKSNFVIAINEDQNKNKIIATWGGGVHIIKNDSIIIPKINNDKTSKIDNIKIINNDIISHNIKGNLYYKKIDSGYTKSIISANYKNSRLNKINIDFFDSPQKQNGVISVLNNTLFLHNGIPLINKSQHKLKGIYSVDSEFKKYKQLPFLKNNVIESLTKLNDSIYAATQKDSIFLFNQKKLIKSYKINISNSTIVNIKKTSNSDLLILTSDKKGFKTAYLFNPKTNHLKNFKTILNTKQPISDIIEDHEGNIWVSSYVDGLYMYNPNQCNFKTINKTSLPESNVKSIINWKTYTTVLTQNHVTLFEGFKKKRVIPLKGFGKAITTTPFNKLYINSVHSKSSKLVFKDYIEKHAFKSFFIDSIGLVEYGDSIRIPKLNKKGIVNNKIILDCILHKDTLWFATNSGYYFYNKHKHALQSSNYNKLNNIEITKLCKNKDTLYIGTRKGLFKQNNDSLSFFDTNNGLLDQNINTLLVDYKNQLWIGSQKGISVYNGKNFVHLSQKTGLLAPYVETLYEDNNYNIWAGGNKGITVINNNTRLQTQEQPLINITQNKATFNYEVISYNRAQSLIIEYKIDHSPWKSELNATGNLDFSNLQKGNHTFILRAKKQDGNWGLSKKYNFKISIPWYKNWVYITVYLSIFFISIIIVIVKQLQKSRSRNIFLQNTIINNQKLEAELTNVKNNIAQDFHDDLGNKLARISILSNLITSNNKTINEEDKKIIHQISNDANYLFKGTKDFIFSLKENSNYIEELITYLSDFGEDYFNQFKIGFIVEKQIDSNIKLPHYWSKQLIFIFKEAMTNSVKHAKATKVELQFFLNDTHLTVKCIDNGIGFKHTAKASIGGLSHMKKRAENINCSLNINTSSSGTTITFHGKTTSKM